MGTGGWSEQATWVILTRVRRTDQPQAATSLGCPAITGQLRRIETVNGALAACRSETIGLML